MYTSNVYCFEKLFNYVLTSFFCSSLNYLVFIGLILYIKNEAYTTHNFSLIKTFFFSLMLKFIISNLVFYWNLFYFYLNSLLLGAAESTKPNIKPPKTLDLAINKTETVSGFFLITLFYKKYFFLFNTTS